MDDILCVYSKNPQWKHEDFVRDFCRSEVYAKPLHLEDGKENTFLETRFKITATNKIDFWLKNENEIEVFDIRRILLVGAPVIDGDSDLRGGTGG